MLSAGRHGRADVDRSTLFVFSGRLRLMELLGKTLVVFGLVLTGLGLLLWSGIGRGWLGRLPGDFSIERGGFQLHFPIVTCILLSVVVSLILAILRR